MDIVLEEEILNLTYMMRDLFILERRGVCWEIPSL